MWTKCCGGDEAVSDSETFLELSVPSLLSSVEWRENPSLVPRSATLLHVKAMGMWGDTKGPRGALATGRDSLISPSGWEPAVSLHPLSSEMDSYSLLALE